MVFCVKFVVFCLRGFERREGGVLIFVVSLRFVFFNCGMRSVCIGYVCMINFVKL